MTVQIPAGSMPATDWDAVVHGSEFDAVGQTATITTQSLIASAPATGMYRVNLYAVVTTAATTSSTLGAATVQFTDPDSGATGTIAASGTQTGNAAGDGLGYVVLVRMKAGAALTFTLTYASSGATAMAFAVHVNVEYLG